MTLPAMRFSARTATVEEILPWRDLYQHEMPGQVLKDSIDSRKGWSQPYFLEIDDVTVGYGSIALAGPWKDKPTMLQFYVLPDRRMHVFDLFEAFHAASGAVAIEAQSDDVLLTVMLHTFATGVESESILFHDTLTTHHPLNGAIFRRSVPEDAARFAPDRPEAEIGQWVIENDGAVVATGGVLYHYNRPYGDVYMETAEPYRRCGFGSLIVQELKRITWEKGSKPGARCNRTNVASRKTLQKAGFVPFGHVLVGSLPT